MFTKKSHYTIHWFRSILLILLPCFLLCTLSSAYMLYISEKNITDINTTITGQVQKNMDNQLEELYKYALTTEISSANTVLKNLKEEPQTMPRQAYQLSGTFSDYLVVNTFIDNVYIYYPNTDLVVGNIGCFPSASYYMLQGYPDSNGYQNWKETLEQAKGIQIKELTFQKENRFCYIHAMKTENTTTSIMVFEINYDRLLADFEPDNPTNAITIGVLSADRLIASVGNPDSLVNLNAMYQEWSGQSETMIRTDNTYAFFCPSSMFNLTYVTLYAAQQFRTQLFLPLLITFGGAVLCIITGITGAFAVSIRNGRPMESIMALFDRKSTSVNEDYQFILQKFEQMTAEKYKNEEFIYNHQLLLNNIFLASILQNNLQNENTIFSEAKRYEVSFESPIYQILILSSGDCRVPDYSSETKQLADLLSDSGYNSLIAAYKHHYVILLNTDEPVSETSLHTLLERLLACAFPGQVSHASVGSYCDTMSGIVTSYHNALHALHSISAEKQSDIAYYSAMEDTFSYGNPDLMKTFSTFIYTKQFQQARELYPQLEKEYLFLDDTQSDYLRTNALANLLSDAAYSILPLQKAAKVTSDLLSSTNRKQEFSDLTVQLLSLLSDFETPQTEHKLPVAARAKQFIDENFADPMMGLYLVSEHLGVSNSYLSASFKRTYDINVISYINQLRVEAAKELILNTQKNIKEIALEVGFSSDINFIRVFKKSENQTPAMLRKKNCE